ncbi:MAG TPA: carbohydrate binding family 9 domain-containing protein, partial [Thermoanaerobaculia bacterium]|nr:carbohydrate binding family 9 domain-containing protein [Thermoanaerobaculia bacterium]
MPRLTGEITLDGDLSEPAWQSAAVVDQFFETSPADNTEPPVKTVAYLTYDDRYFYIGIHAYDPHPEAIRAPYVERDAVIGTDDNVAVFLDTRNDRRSALELRVNARGIQGDAIYDDGTGNEDFSPDTFYDTAAKITADGWTAEYRIPFSSLRYPKLDEVHWGILIWRNYPRDQRYAFHSSPIPRGSNCWVCQSRELTGLTGLPGGGHLVVAPYVTGQRLGEPANGLGSPIRDQDAEADGGLDVKWTPTA